MEDKISQEEFLKELLSVRLIVLLEVSPQSNKYRQIILDPQRFHNMAIAMGAIPINGVFDPVNLKMSNDVYHLPEMKQSLDK